MTKTAIDDAQIRETAYLIWLDEGQPTGRDQEHWLKAIEALTPAKPKRKTAASKAEPKPKAAAKPKSAAKATKTKAAAKPKAKAKATAS